MKKQLTIATMVIGALLCLSTNTLSAQCDGRRPDINDDFTSAERIELRNLIMEYLNSQTNNDFPAFPETQYTIVGIHSGFAGQVQSAGGWHNYQEEFLTWHRAYIQGLENFLVNKGATQFVPLPAWHNINEIPDEFFNDEGSDGVNSVLPSTDGFPSLGNQGPFGTGATDFSDFDENLNCNSWTDIDDYASDLEGGPHDNTHGSISGSMGNVRDASGAAIFWLFHAYVDDLYYCYQTNCQSLESDVWMKDDANDDGTEPNPVDIFYLSPDIFSADGWIDGGGGLNIQQNNGEAVTIAVRVRNRGDIPNENGVGEIKLYWAHASTGLGWPAPFDGSDLLNCPNPEPAGGFIASQPLRSVNENYVDVFDVDNDGDFSETLEDYTIYYFEWMPPDPDNYVGCFGDDWQHRHFCIMARIEEPDGMTFPETGNYWENIRNNNNIVLRNIALWGNGIPGGIAPPDPPEDCILVGNYTPVTMNNARFEITFPEAGDVAMLNNVELRIKFSPELHGKWETGGELGAGVTEEVINGEKWVRFQQANAKIEGFSFAPYEIAEGCVSIEPIDTNNTEGFYNFDIRQYSGNVMIGGERFEVDLKSVIEGRSSNGSANEASKQIEQVTGGFLILPNPAKDYFTVSSLDFGEENTMQVYNEIGQLVFSAEFAGTSYNAKTNGFGKGMFIVKIKVRDTGKEFVEKLFLY